MTDAPTSEALIRDITRAWEEAKAQLESLREAVAETGKLGELRLQSLGLQRERDAALRELGAQVHSELAKGRLTLPAALKAAAEAVDAIERRRAQKASEISDILSEGAEAATRRDATPKNSKSAVTLPPKKR